MKNPAFHSSFERNQGLCGENSMGLKVCVTKKSSKLWNGVLAGAFAVATLIILWIGLYSFHRRYRTSYAVKVVNNSARIWTRFHKLNFLEGEIVNVVLNDDNRIGSGGYGNVYKATLSNGQIVAIKQLRQIGCPSGKANNDSGFQAEVETLGTIRHKNIVKLLCCCFDSSDESLLVYEYMEKGSLNDALHGTKASLLDLASRYKIAVGSARGLAYLHHDCKPPIVHRDVKPDNILLDSNYEAHVADFGLARILQNNVLVTENMGTPGYLAPEHQWRGRHEITEKSDVYSFGIVLLELLTGKTPLDQEIGREATDIVSWVSERTKSNDEFNEGFDEILDPSLWRCTGSGLEKMVVMFRVALQCTKALPKERPTMREVVKMLTEHHSKDRAVSEHPETLLLQKRDPC